MALSVTPFGPEHLFAAAELLAARHRVARALFPGLPARYMEAAAAREVIASIAEEALARHGAGGVAALDGGRLTGYLLGEYHIGAPYGASRLALVSYVGHAVDPACTFDTVRALYAALAPLWNDNGCHGHYVSPAAWDGELLAAWRSLGFGAHHTRGMRDTAPVGGSAPRDLRFRAATADDARLVGDLVTRLARHHTDAPVWDPFTEERATADRATVVERLADPTITYWLAERAGRVLGTIALSPPRPYAAMLAPDRGIHIDEAYVEPEARGEGAGTALLDWALECARDAGLEWCTVSWAPHNISAARFWTGHGFRPTMQRVARIVDPRIAWSPT